MDDTDNHHIEIMSGFDCVYKVTTVYIDEQYVTYAIDLVFSDARHDLLHNVCVDKVHV